MNSYSLVVSLHVIAIILGLGPVTTLVIATGGTPSPAFPYERIRRLMRITAWSLPAVLATGAAAIALTHGAMGESTWMKISFLLFLFLGFLHVLGRRILHKAAAVTPPAPPPRSLAWTFRTMAVVIAAITWLMEAKPWW